jgi:hypothetical protein
MAVRFTYHGSPFAQQIMNQGFKPGGLMSIAPGQVFSSPNAAFASSYGSPVRMVTPTSALSIPSANLNMKTIGSEVIQSPKAATKGMNLASKVGTTYTGPTAQRLMSGATVAGLGAPPSSSLAMRAVGGPFGLAALAGQGIGMGVDAIARAVNTPEEYEAMKEAARAQGGFGYFDDVDISQDAVSPVDTNEPMNIEDFLGTSVPQNVTIGQAPSVFDINTMGDPALNPGSVNVFGVDPFGVNEDLIERGAVAEEGAITDRGRGMPGTMGAYEMIGGTPVAVGDVLGRQQALEKADFFEEPKSKLDAGGLLSLMGLITQSKPIQLASMLANRDKIGRGIDKVKTGVGSLGGNITRKMRGVNPDGTTRTQTQYEQAREERRQQNRTDRMIDRIVAGKSTRSNPRDAGTTKAQKDAISAALRESRRGQQYTDKDSSGSTGDGGRKVICTMMNERYGFGSFRNKIWMKFHENHGPEYEKGYHAIFLPLVKIAKGEGKINTAVRKVLEHMGRHVTADMFKIMKGKKRDPLGRIYRAIFEPTCRIIGKIKSALGRG